MAGWWRCWLPLMLITLPGRVTPQPVVPPTNPSLTARVNGVDDAKHRRQLQMRQFDLSVEVRGAVAETIVEAAFVNDTREVLEGDFRMSLPSGSVVTGYALDIDGKMIDGVLVDRPRAKAVYQERVRRGIDPGVAEVTPDNQFRTTVYPIQPGKGRTIRLRFVTPIPPAGLRMPLATELSWEERKGVTVVQPTYDGVKIRVRSGGTETPVMVSWPGQDPIAVPAGSEGLQVQQVGPAPAFSGDLVIVPGKSPGVLVSRHSNGERYLQLTGISAVPPGRPQPQRVRIYWDRSRSRLGTRLDDEILLVRRFIERLRPSSIEMVAFNSSGADRLIVKDAAEAVSWLKALQYRGATSFAAIAADPLVDACLLFSDGRVTIDRDTNFSPRCRLDAVSSAANADMTWLRHAAQLHGGQAIALNGDNGDAVLAALSTFDLSVIAVEDRDGRLLPFVPLETAAGQWRIIARAPEGGKVMVRLSDGIYSSQPVVSLADEKPFDGEATLIGSDVLATLGATEQRADFVALSRRYGIASPSLSFLVLETPGDYIAADIAPPASYPAAARAEYLSQRAQRKTERDEARRERMTQLLEDWNEQVAWWKTKFDPAARPKRAVAAQASGRELVAGVPRPGMLPPPPPPPPMSMPAPPASVMEPPRVRAPAPILAAPAEVGNIIVTAQRRVERGGASGGVVEIDAWSPERPYLELYDGAPAQFDARFLEAEARRGSIPAFYFDTAEWLRKHGRKAEAIEMLLSALELPAANEVTFGIIAAKLERYGAFDRAVELRERHAALDPHRPQPKRLLALALARRAAAQPGRARADLDRAIRLLADVAMTGTDDDGNDAWDGIDLIALMEANALVPKLRALGGRPALDPQLIALLDVDVRVVVDWTSDATDLDLWVDEPGGERAIYSNQRTAIGGHLSDDMTSGYGPEEYLLRYAPSGTYTVQANVFASDPLDPNGASIVTTHLIRDFGRSTEREDSVDIELTPKDDGEKMIGRIVVPPRKAPRR